jgi:hypothetical protein
VKKMGEESMQKRACLVAVVLFILIMAALVTKENKNQPLMVSGGDWGVVLGSQYLFSISVTGLQTSFVRESPPELAVLNNTMILATITDLPATEGAYTNDSFLSGLVLKTKVSCSFENGTAIVEPYLSHLIGLLSYSILPVEMWEGIDLLYADDYNRSYSWFQTKWSWVARFENDSLFFAHQGIGYHGSEGWRAWVALDTGMPALIEDYSDFIWGSGPSYHLMRLVQVIQAPSDTG